MQHNQPLAILRLPQTEQKEEPNATQKNVQNNASPASKPNGELTASGHFTSLHSAEQSTTTISQNNKQSTDPLNEGSDSSNAAVLSQPINDASNDTATSNTSHSDIAAADISSMETIEAAADITPHPDITVTATYSSFEPIFTGHGGSVSSQSR